MARPRLHLDADVSRKDLHEALVSKGHDVTRAPRHTPGQPAKPFAEEIDFITGPCPDEYRSRRLGWSGALAIRVEIRLSFERYRAEG